MHQSAALAHRGIETHLVDPGSWLLSQVADADIDRFRAFFHGMLEHGVYLAPSAFEAGFVSAAHGDDEIAQTLDAARAVMPTLAR